MRGRTEERVRVTRTGVLPPETLEVVPKIPEGWKQEAEFLEPSFIREAKTFPPFKRFWIENKVYPAVVTFGIQTKEAFKVNYKSPVRQKKYLVEGDIPSGGTDTIGVLWGTFEIEVIRIGIHVLLAPDVTECEDIYFRIVINGEPYTYLYPFSAVIKSRRFVANPGLELVTWVQGEGWLIVDNKNSLFITESFHMEVNNESNYDIEYLVLVKTRIYNLEERIVPEAFLDAGEIVIGLE